jgi:tripartite-type tricarboxylate transporter receptor subunit TctC
MRPAFGVGAFASAIFWAFLAGVDAAEFPDRSIHVILATGAGGTADVFARALSEGFQKRTGQGFIVDNKSGGQSNIGGRACVDAPADGYNICLVPDEVLVLNQFLFKKLNYDPPNDFAPITNPVFNTQVIVAATSLGVKSMVELSELAKKKPGTLSYSVMSTSMQMFMDDWNRKRGSDIVNVPVRGGPDTVTGVMTGTIPIAIVGLQNWLGQIQGGLVVPLAVNSKERSPLLPDTPTLGELGYPDEPKQFFGFAAPAKTPKPLIDKLFEAIKAAGEEPRFRKQRIVGQGLEPVFDDPASFGNFLSSERIKAKARIEKAGIEPR